MAKSKKRKQQKKLDMVIEEFDYDTLLDYATKNRCKKNAYSFQNEFKNHPESDVSRIISNLCKMVINCMEKYLAGNAAGNWASSDADSRNMVGKLIHVAVDITIVSLQFFHLQCHVEIAVLLNGILPAIPDNQDNVKNSIAQYCEKLCLTNFADKSEYFLYNVFPYLLNKTLGKKKLKADIKRIYAIRNKLEAVMELKEAPREEIWKLFKQCAVSQTYVSIMEGQKVIALAMSLDIDKISEIHQEIRKILPESNIKYAPSYGKIYFETWYRCVKSGKNDIKNVIEISCLQDFILSAIRAGRRPLLPIIRKILAQFHIHKKDQEVSSMLYCLYQPLLWRFLKNPDGQIRANATQLFLDIFPLEDPEVKVVATDLELNDQLLMIRDLLVDDFPIVRITTVLGICISMSVNWEVYPEEMIKTYFRIIVNDLSRDSSNSEVRCAVVKGLKCLLENPLTVHCLVGILPKMGGLFHDISENVRIAFCQLLLRVKNISAIKFFKIVPANHLLARLQEDCHAVKKSITNLLNNSYFPKYEDSKVWLGRCLELIRTEKNASRVFFSYAGCFLEVEGSVRFMIQAIRAVHFYVKTKNSPLPETMELCNKENILNMNEYLSSLEEAVGFNNLNVVKTVMDAIAVMWLSLKRDIEKPGNKFFLKMLVAKISQPLADLCLYYQNTIAWESVFYVSSFLPPPSVPSLGSLCFLKLKNLPVDAKPDDYMTLLECLCNQRQGFELLNLLKEWIEVGLNDVYVPPPTKKRRKKRSSESIRNDQAKPYFANQILDFMIGRRSLQKAMLAHEQVVKEMLYFIDYIKKKLERFNVRGITETEASFLSLLMYNILRLSVLLHDESRPGGIEFLHETVEWANKTLIQYLTFSDETTDNFTSLIYTVCQNLCQIVADVTALGFCDPDSCIYLSFFENLLCSGLGYKFALIVSRFLYKHAASGMFMYLLDNDTVMLQHLLKSLHKFFDCFCNETLLQKISQQDNIKFTLANVMQVAHSHIVVLNEPTSQVFRCVLRNILDSLIVKTKTIVDELDDDPFDKMSFPKIGAFFMAILNLKPKLIPTYIKFLTEMFLSSNKDIVVWIANWAIVYNILDKKDMTKPILREANVLVHNLGKTIHEMYPRKKKSDQNNSEESAESPQMQIFQRHCHAEFLKLRSCLSSKVSALKDVKTN